MHNGSRVMAVAVAGAIAAAGCPGGGGKPTGPKLVPDSPTIDQGRDLPEVPVKIVTTASAPMEGNTPAAASPILEAMAAENARWMAQLAGQPDPAYYLSYQVVEQRAVGLDAEGGALISDSDETARNLDIDIRVGSPALDNTRALSDDDGLNSPRARRGVFPFGTDPDAIKNHLWLETGRRYREALQALVYVKQDQQTLSKVKKRPPDFSASEPVVYAEPVAKLEFDKAAWIARLKACS